MLLARRLGVWKAGGWPGGKPLWGEGPGRGRLEMAVGRDVRRAGAIPGGRRPFAWFSPPLPRERGLIRDRKALPTGMLSLFWFWFPVSSERLARRVAGLGSEGGGQPAGAMTRFTADEMPFMWVMALARDSSSSSERSRLFWTALAWFTSVDSSSSIEVIEVWYM